MIARRHRRRRELHGAELELTAFINPMVVLVTFLLMTVVFSHSAILDLHLPGPGGGASATAPEPLQLEIIVHKNDIQVADRVRGVIATLPDDAQGSELARLTEQLQQLKARYPDTKDASVLSEPDVSYDRLVQIMDVVRSYETRSGNQRSVIELFPQISLGDAPVAEKK
jgi:biopolymer transport protein ExbD